MMLNKKIVKTIAFILSVLTVSGSNYTGLADSLLGEIQETQVSLAREEFDRQICSSQFADADRALYYYNRVSLPKGGNVNFMMFNAKCLLAGFPKSVKDIDSKRSEFGHESLEKLLREGNNIFLVLINMYVDSKHAYAKALQECTTDEDALKESFAKIAEIIDSSFYKYQGRGLIDFSGGDKILSEAEAKEIMAGIMKSINLNTLDPKKKAILSQCMLFGSLTGIILLSFLFPPLAGAITVLGESIFVSGLVVSGVSDQQHIAKVNIEKLINISSILRQLVNNIYDDPEQVSRANALLIAFDARECIDTSKSLWKNLFRPIAYTYRDNKGAELSFRQVRNLQGAPDFGAYRMGGQSVLSAYIDIFNALKHVSKDDVEYLEILQRKIRTGVGSVVHLPASSDDDKKLDYDDVD